MTPHITTGDRVSIVINDVKRYGHVVDPPKPQYAKVEFDDGSFGWYPKQWLTKEPSIGVTLALLSDPGHSIYPYGHD